MFFQTLSSIEYTAYLAKDEGIDEFLENIAFLGRCEVMKAM